MNYLEKFYQDLQKQWLGSLVRVKSLNHPYAKEFMHQLTGKGLVERVAWGWYWVPAPVKDAWEFLARDKNFKVLADQTAASFWNGDFIHRDAYIIKVQDASYGKALSAFGQKKGWNFIVKIVRHLPPYVAMDGLLVEDLENTILHCLQEWSFMDAFAALNAYKRKIDLNRLLRAGYWRRLSGTNLRVKKVLEYGCARLSSHPRHKIRCRLNDPFIAREIEEAVEKVKEIG